MLWVFKVVLLIVGISTLLMLLFNYKNKKKYESEVEKIQKKYKTDLSQVPQFPIWTIENTLIITLGMVTALPLILMFQTAMNVAPNVTVENLSDGKYVIIPVSINEEDYALLENSEEKSFLLENGEWITWSKRKNCEIIIKREENLKEPYVTIDVERVGSFWKDAVLDVYRVSNMKVYLSENSKIFDYSGIENYMDVNSNYHK